MSDAHQVAVVGGGAAGSMAALRAVLNALDTIWFLGDLDARRRSRAQWVSAIDDMPGFSGRPHPITHTALDVQQWIDAQAPLRSRLQVVKRSLDALVGTADGFDLTWVEKHRRDPVGTTHTARARYVVLATGIEDVQPHIRGSIDPIFPFANANQVLYSLRSDGHRVIGHPTAVIGHTTEAAWTAITLVERYAPPAMALLTHGLPFGGDAETRHLIKRYGIDVHEGVIDEIAGQARKEGLQGFVIDGVLIRAERAFVALGTRAHHDLARQAGAALDDRGFVLTSATGETSIRGLYAIGDLQAGSRQQVYSAWGSAVDAIDDIDRRVRLARRPSRRDPVEGG
jgi:thioredoxin reductase (NADPH)